MAEVGSGRSLRVAERLEKRFGLGDSPDLRRRFFWRLECLVDKYGSDVDRIIGVIVSSSMVARDPARYFCVSVARELERRGFRLVDDSEEDF